MKTFIIIYKHCGHVEIMSEHGTFESARRELKRIMKVVARVDKKYYFITNKNYSRGKL